MKGQDEALKMALDVGGEIDRLKAEVEKADAELRSIDAVLARRPALADLGSRWEKIEHACSTAGRATDKVTRLESALAAVTRERETAQAQVQEWRGKVAALREWLDSAVSAARSETGQPLTAVNAFVRVGHRMDSHGLTSEPPREKA